MHIELSKLLENNTSTTNYELKKRLYIRSASWDLDNNNKNKKAMAKVENNKVKAKDS